MASIAASVMQNAVMLKTAYLDPFSDGALKVRIFIQQMDNKIADASLATDTRKIRYATSLLRRTVAERAIIHANKKGHTTFLMYKEFRESFLGRFTEPNSMEIAMKKLLNLKQRRTDIQEYRTKMLTLTNKAELRDQAAKTLMFRGLHSRDQDRMIMANSIKTEKELKEEILDKYLERITRLLRREEVRRQEITGKETGEESMKSVT